MALSNVDGAMTGRGALIKPWIFQEFYTNTSIEFTAKERIELVYFRLTTFMKEYFGETRLEKKIRFIHAVAHWILCRYRPLDEAVYREKAKLSPLLQTRLDIALENEGTIDDLEPLERLLRCVSRKLLTLDIAEILFQSETSDEAIEKLTRIAESSKLAEYEFSVSSPSSSGRESREVDDDDMRG